MAGKTSRRKGKAGEREVAKILRPLWPDVKRGWQSRSGEDAPDVDGSPYWVEVKRTERENIRSAYNQGMEATDGRPVLVFSRRSRTPWLVTMDVETFKALCKREGEPALPASSDGLGADKNS